MNAIPQVLVFDTDADRNDGFESVLRRRGFKALRQAVNDVAGAHEQLGGQVAVVRIDGSAASEKRESVRALLRRLAAEHAATLVWGADPGLDWVEGPLLEYLDADAGLDVVLGKIGTLVRYGPLIRGFERELKNLQHLGEQLNHYFNEIDQEMRLAGRLQRDFLPRKLPELPGYEFQAVYRPASWVSGDMYDVFRIDEQHVGMFVADAMGHGVAAGLLTMFLRQALVAKRVEGESYAILAPAEALENLHGCLVQQKLPNCQFVTAAYGILNTRTRQLRVARGGHPYGLQIRPTGEVREIRTEGSLLGLADIPTEFEETTVQLTPGEKLIFYTDGMEDVILMPRHAGEDATVFTAQFQEWARLPAAELAVAVEQHLDCREGSLHPADDVTLLVVEVQTGAP